MAAKPHSKFPKVSSVGSTLIPRATRVSRNRRRGRFCFVRGSVSGMELSFTQGFRADVALADDFSIGDLEGRIELDI